MLPFSTAQQSCNRNGILFLCLLHYISLPFFYILLHVHFMHVLWWQEWCDVKSAKLYPVSTRMQGAAMEFNMYIEHQFCSFMGMITERRWVRVDSNGRQNQLQCFFGNSSSIALALPLRVCKAICSQCTEPRSLIQTVQSQHISWNTVADFMATICRGMVCQFISRETTAMKIGL